MTQLVQHIEHFHQRVLQDALAEATTAYWLRRAETFAAVGNQRCDQIASACRNHARLLELTGLDAEAGHAIATVLTERGQAAS